MLWGGAELLEEPPFWQAKTNLPAKGGGEARYDLSKPWSIQSQAGRVEDERFVPCFCNIVVFPFLFHLASLLV